MAKKTALKARKKKKNTSKAPPKKKVVKRKELTPQEQKMSIVADYLEEVFHLIGHSVQEAPLEQKPWDLILSSMIYLHNQLDSNVGHHIREAILSCECDTKEHRIKPQEIDHECDSVH